MKKSKQNNFNNKKNEDFEDDNSFKIKRRKAMKNKYKKKRIKGYLDQDLYEL